MKLKVYNSYLIHNVGFWKVLDNLEQGTARLKM